MTVGDGARESAREERNNTTERKDQAQGEEQKGRKIEEENDQKEARTPAICHSDLTYRGILDVSYLPLIAASVIQAEDKRGRNKIRTGSTGLPYSPLRRAPTSRGSAATLVPSFPPRAPPFLPPALSGEEETISPTFLGSESTRFSRIMKKSSVSLDDIVSARGFRKIEGACEAERLSKEDSMIERRERK